MSTITPSFPANFFGNEPAQLASRLTKTDLATLAEVRGDTIYNWSGIHSIARKSQLVKPETEQQLSKIVRESRGKIHIIGTGLSYEQIATLPLNDPTSTLISVEHFKGLISIHHDRQTAIFGAATPVNQIISTLGEHDMMIACSPGVVGIQTIAGALATGTHGQGLFQSAYSDTVVSLRVCLPSGQIIDVDENTKDYPLQAFVTSVGMLGVILHVELKMKPRAVLYCHKTTCNFDEFLENYPEWNENSHHVKAWWFPETDQVQLWRVDEANPQLSSTFLSTDRKAPFETDNVAHSMQDTVDRYVEKLSHDTNSSATSHQPQFLTVKRFADTRNLVGYTEQILTKGIPVPQINCEIAVPLKRFREATAALHQWNKENAGKLHYPFIYRAVGKSDAWLSPVHEGPAVWIGFLVYIGEDGSVRRDGMETMERLQELLAGFGGLPHWGKHFVPKTYDFEGKIRNWNNFLELRKRVDPTGRFLSRFMSEIIVNNQKLSAEKRTRNVRAKL
ncbi:FAD binding domain containing protein [Planoprotostelium fungivorum]|uniref:FAD binding domain containing protein n=1 Tax=Planoprotostelium fungivorum TaxID=1890364 RepID=A0A2P6N9J2_9EUKA|nr:FAD binding domain containing protein [Planoprotostelium fungivorum]